LESKRISNEIGSSLEAKISLYSSKPEIAKLLKENKEILSVLFITSQVEILEAEPKDVEKCGSLPLWISATKADGAKCSRCWNYSASVGKDKEFGDICSKCAVVVRK